MRDRFRGVVGIVGVAAITLALFAGSAEAADKPSASAGSAPGDLFVVTTTGQSDESAIAARAAVDPAYKAKAIALATSWVNQMKAGATLPLGTMTQDKSAASGLATVIELKAALEKPTTAPSNGPSTATSAAVPGALGVSAMASLDPNSFVVSGYPGSGRTYWTGLYLTMTGNYCGTSGCSITDKITCRPTINPGAFVSMISSTCGYFPNAGNFGNKHYEIWDLNRGSIVADANTGDLTTPGSYYVYSSRGLNSTVLTTAMALWVYINPLGYYGSESAKTTDATCRPPGDNSCIY